MDRTGIEDSNNLNNRLNNSVNTVEGNPSVAVAITENNRKPVTITNVENLVSVNTNSKDKDTVNEDDINIFTRTRVDEINDHPDTPRQGRKPVNYAAKKTIAQGMIDLALITSNANQLKNLIEYQSNSRAFWFVLVMIVISLMLQVSVGISLIFKGRFDKKHLKDKAAAARVDKWMMASVFMITVINVFIAAFGSSPPVPSIASGSAPSTT